MHEQRTRVNKKRKEKTPSVIPKLYINNCERENAKNKDMRSKMEGLERRGSRYPNACPLALSTSLRCAIKADENTCDEIKRKKLYQRRS